MNKTKAHCTQC